MRLKNSKLRFLASSNALYSFEKNSKTILKYSKIQPLYVLEKPLNLNDKTAIVSCYDSTDEIQFLSLHMDTQTYSYKFTLIDEPQMVK